jgi:hypothetical protein
LGVNLDDDPANGLMVAKSQGLPWDTLVEKYDQAAARFNLDGIPFYLIIGKDGRIAQIGPRNHHLLEKLIEQELAR